LVAGWSFYALIAYVTDATYCGRLVEHWSRWHWWSNYSHPYRFNHL